MPSRNQSLKFTLFAPSLNQAQLDAILAAVESVLPTEPLCHRIDDTGNLHKVGAPGQWLWKQLLAGDTALLCNGNEDRYVGTSVMILPPGIHAAGQVVRIGLTLHCIPEFMERLHELAQALGPAAGAYWGDATPTDAAGAIMDRFTADASMRPPPVPPAVPLYIGWVNYWSAATLHELGIVDGKAPELAVFCRVAECDGGGLALQLTETPLDLENPAHLAAVEAAYGAFPALNTRARFDTGKRRIRETPDMHDLQIDLYAPVISVEQMGALIAATEAALATGPLRYCLDNNGYIDEIADPAAWLARNVDGKQHEDVGPWGALCNGDEHRLVKIHASTLWPGVLPERMRAIRIDLPGRPDLAAALFDLLADLGPLLNAWRGHAATARASFLSSVQRRELSDNTADRSILQQIEPEPWRRHPALPDLIGWINYWSPATCNLLVPDAGQSTLFAHIRRLDNGGVVAQLTGEPLDPDDRADHRAALDAVYAAFPILARGAIL